LVCYSFRKTSVLLLGLIRVWFQDAYIGSASKSWITTGLSANHTNVNGQTIQQSLIIIAALPQVLIAGGLYLLLALAALVITSRTPGAPFTLAGILMMHSKLAVLCAVPSKDQGFETKHDKSSRCSTKMGVTTVPQ
jgi:hypothetical protein